MFWALLTFSLSSAFFGEDKLLSLTDSNFADLIENKEALILFFDPTCPSSFSAYQAFAQAAEKLAPQESFVLCKFDSYKNVYIPTALRIEAYPAVVYYKSNSSNFVYNQPITYKNIVTMIDNIVNPRLKLLNPDKVSEFFNPEIVSFILFDDAKSLLSWKIAKSSLEYPPVNIAHSTDKSLARELNLNWGSLYAINNYHGIKDELSEFTYESITTFIKKRDLHKALPLSSAYDYVIDQGLPAIYIFRNESEGANIAQLINETLPELGDFRIVYADLHSNIIFSRTIGLPATAQPAMMLIEPVKNNLFKYIHSDKTITKKVILELIQNWREKKAKRYFKTSQEVEGELNGHSFQKYIENTVSDTLVHFFAPWCDHCRKLDEELEVVEKNVTGLRIVRINAEDNEVPEHVIDEYPTLKFFYPVNKKWTVFNEFRSVGHNETLWERIALFVKYTRKDKRTVKKTENRDL